MFDLPMEDINEINEGDEDFTERAYKSVSDKIEEWKKYFKDKRKEREEESVIYPKPPLIGEERRKYLKYKKLEESKNMNILSYSEQFMNAHSLFWDEMRGILYFVDEIKKAIVKFTLDKEEFKIVVLEGHNGPAFVIPLQNKAYDFIVGIGYHIFQVEWNGRQPKCSSVQMILEQEREGNQIQYGKADHIGRIVFGSSKLYAHGNEMRGYLKIYEAKRTITDVQKMHEQLWTDFAWSWNGTNIFLINTNGHVICSYNYNIQEGRLGDKQLTIDWHDLELEGAPRCITCDIDENLWIGCSGKGEIIQMNPRTKSILNKIYIERVSDITSVVFGGTNRDILFVTTNNVIEVIDDEEDTARRRSRNDKGFSSLYKIVNVHCRGLADFKARIFDEK